MHKLKPLYCTVYAAELLNSN